MGLQVDNYHRRDAYAPSKKPILLIGCVLSLLAFIFAYANDLLPHYTATIDGGTVTLVRDDPRYLAEQAARELEANRQIYRINGSEVSKADYDRVLQSLQDQQKQDEIAQVAAAIDAQNSTQHNQPPVQQNQQHVHDAPTGQARKCTDARGRAVYQSEPCSSNGLRTEKILTARDGAISQATYNYKQAEESKIANTVYKVDGRIVSKAEFDQIEENNRRISAQEDQNQEAYCKSLDAQRENIRSQQRQNSNQHWRDRYAAVSKEWQSRCLVSSQGMS